MAELHTAARAASRVRETPASILFRIGVIFAVLFSLTFTAPAGTAIAQNASADQPTKKGQPGKKPNHQTPRRSSPAAAASRGQQQQKQNSTCRLQLGAAARDITCIAPAELPFAFSRSQKKMTALRANPVRACWRQPWEKLRSEFISIYQSKTDGPLAAKALRKAAECQRHLAGCSHLGEDYRLAVKIYEAAAGEYPKNQLAPENLYDAYLIASENLNDRSLALALADRIRKQYPASQAARKISGAGKNSSDRTDSAETAKSGKPELENLSWDTISKNEMEIVLGFTAPVQTQARIKSKSSSGAVLELDIRDAAVVSEIRRGVSIRGSMLRNIAVKTLSPKRSVVLFTFSALRHFSTKTQKGGKEIVLSVDNLATQKTPGVQSSGRSFAGGNRQGRLADLASMAAPGLSTITIDAGHGGSDPGTSHNGIREENITLDIALRLGRLLRDNGYRVIYTRKTDSGISLAGRTAKANENQSDLFVSIHVNSHSSPSVAGFETYYLDRTAALDAAKVVDRENGRQSRVQRVTLSGRVLESRRLAISVQRHSVSRVRSSGFAISGHGVKGAPFFVLSATSMPAILAEVGYCTNKAEADLLGRPAYRQAIAAGIAEGVMAYSSSRSGRITAENSGRQAIR